jgi:DNA-binding beta-propeller fold protein YncE
VAIGSATNQPLRRIKIATGSQVPVVDGDTVWVTSTDQNLVTAVDARTGEIIETTATGRGRAVPPRGRRSIWTLNQGDDSVTRIDASARQINATIPLGLTNDYPDDRTGIARDRLSALVV